MKRLPDEDDDDESEITPRAKRANLRARKKAHRQNVERIVKRLEEIRDPKSTSYSQEKLILPLFLVFAMEDLLPEIRLLISHYLFHLADREVKFVVELYDATPLFTAVFKINLHEPLNWLIHRMRLNNWLLTEYDAVETETKVRVRAETYWRVYVDPGESEEKLAQWNASLDEEEYQLRSSLSDRGLDPERLIFSHRFQ